MWLQIWKKPFYPLWLVGRNRPVFKCLCERGFGVSHSVGLADYFESLNLPLVNQWYNNPSMNPVVLNNKLLLVAVTELLFESVQHLGATIFCSLCPVLLLFHKVCLWAAAALQRPCKLPTVHAFTLHYTHPLMGWRWDVCQTCRGLFLIVHLGDRILFLACVLENAYLL